MGWWQASRVCSSRQDQRSTHLRNHSRGPPLRLYLDTSALLKLYVDETGASAVRAGVEAASLLATSRLAFVEARAGLARRRRSGDLTSAEHRRLVEEFETDWERYVKIEVSEPLVVSAAELAERHRLRAYDALHLASVLSLAGRAADPPTFCCWDGDLLTAASREGLAFLRVS